MINVLNQIWKAQKIDKEKFKMIYEGNEGSFYSVLPVSGRTPNSLTYVILPMGYSKTKYQNEDTLEPQKSLEDAKVLARITVVWRGVWDARLIPGDEAYDLEELTDLAGMFNLYLPFMKHEIDEKR